MYSPFASYSSIMSSAVLISGGTILTCLPIVAAVDGWSPVTMITLIPAFLQVSIAGGTVTLGGSIRATTPMKVSSVIGKLNFYGVVVSNLYPG